MTLLPQSYTSVMIECQPGFDGGVNQTFVLKVSGDVEYSVQMHRMVMKTKPLWYLKDSGNPINN